MQQPEHIRRWSTCILGWGVAGCLTVLLLVGILRCMVFSDLFHAFEHHRLGTTQRFTQVSRMTVVQQLQAYFRSDSQQLLDHHLFSYREKLHYREVKQVLHRTETVFACGVVGFIGLTIGLLYRGGRTPGWQLRLIAAVGKRVAVILVGVIAICGLFALNFDAVFLHFHTIVFTTKNWLLPSSSATIQLFPPRYFFDFFLVYITLVLGAAALFATLAMWVSTWAPRWASAVNIKNNIPYTGK